MLTDAFCAWAKRNPQAKALGYDGLELDYATLLQQSYAVARLLASKGMGPGDRVALIMPKSNQAIVALLGILLAGAAYVPLDPRSPPARLSNTLADCNPAALITTVAILDRITATDPTLVRNLRSIVTSSVSGLDNGIVHDFSQKAQASSPSFPREEDQPAYLLYTSGSTGEPKAVVHSHHSAVSFIQWAINAFDLRPGQRMTNHAQLSFDLSIFDVFGALSSGATVEIVRPELLLRPKEFVNKLTEWQISTLYAVPSAIALLESNGDLRQHPPNALTRVLYAGEPFSVSRLRSVMQALPNARFFNLFGPTETNVCTYYPIPTVPTETTSHIPIGHACNHLTVDLLDEQACATPEGEEGEICVAGPSVMSGYFRRADATQGVFHEGSRFPDGRARYRTGDRAITDNSGVLWFNGRRDRLVKRRGYRIELGEIEAALSNCFLVSEAAAIAITLDESVQVTAAVVLRIGHEATALTLKAHCGRLLPPYMLPDSIAILSEMPRTQNGKVDLRRLCEKFAV